jgi:hypothetical protein
VALQIDHQPAEIKPRWKAYIADTYSSSGVVREHLACCEAWYAEDLLRLLPTKAIETQSSTKTASPAS